MFKPQVVARDLARQGVVAVLPRRRRVKSRSRRLHDRAQFWLEHGEKVRLVLIGGGMAFLAALLVTLAIG